MNKNELLENRAKAISAMENLVETRGENMDGETLAAIKDFKEKITGYDNQLEAIEEIRSVALKNTQPKAEKMENNKVELRNLFDSYYRGKIEGKELEREIRTMTTADGAGGETIDDVMANQILEVMVEFGTLEGDISKIKTSEGGTLTFPIYDDTANEGAIVAEGGVIGLADAVTSEVALNSYKIGTAIKVSRELVEDSKFDIQAYLVKSLGIRLSKISETLYLTGTGTAQPKGILVSAATKEVTTAAINTVDQDDFLNLEYAVQPSARIGAKYWVSDTMLKEMKTWKDSTGRSLLQMNASATAANGIQMSINGYEIVVHYGLDPFVSGTAGNSVLFGNASNYMKREVADVRVERSTEVHFTTDEVIYKATARFDSDVIAANDSFAKLTLKIA